MQIEQLAQESGIRIALAPSVPGGDIAKVFGANTMSGLLANASPDCLLVTGLANPQLGRIAELMDVPGICLVDDLEPGAELLAAARAAGVALLVSSRDLASTTCALQERLAP